MYLECNLNKISNKIHSPFQPAFVRYVPCVRTINELNSPSLRTNYKYIHDIFFVSHFEKGSENLWLIFPINFFSIFLSFALFILDGAVSWTKFPTRFHVIPFWDSVEHLNNVLQMLRKSS